VNTPAHIVLNAYVLGRGRFARFAWPIAFGALLPDLPMLLFYAYQRGWLRVSERAIWSQTYFLPHWQTFFDAFNSLPLIALGAFFAWRTKRYAWLACCASMALHSVADLLLHHEDAHGHFWPLSAWRFRSPLSYWDPRHHGAIFVWLELAASLAACVLLWRRGGSWRAIGSVGGALYAAGIGFALWMWSGLAER
jgi:hypothetical protein